MVRKAIKENLENIDSHIIKCHNRIVWLKGLADIESHNKYRDKNEYFAHVELYRHLSGQLTDYLKGINEYNSRLQLKLRGQKGLKYRRLRHRCNSVFNAVNNTVVRLQAELLMERLQDDFTGESLKNGVIPAIKKLQKIDKRLEKLRYYIHGFQ